MERIWEIKGYNSRRGAVDSWYHDITRDPPPEAASGKPRSRLMSLGRKRSCTNVKDPSKASSQDLPGSRRGSEASSEDAICPTMDGNFVFNTSLSAGMPMKMLEREHLRCLLPDLPALQQIWSTTAEALILDRKIVGRPQDIKRNAQVMLDLIKDDGVDEEDEWWYGRNTPDSVRPLLEAIEEDPVEGV